MQSKPQVLQAEGPERDCSIPGWKASIRLHGSTAAYASGALQLAQPIIDHQMSLQWTSTAAQDEG